MNAILRLCVLAALAVGSALLLWSSNPEPPPDKASTGASEKAGRTPADPASYAGLIPPAKAPEAKACCDKPPTRAALLRGAAPASSP